MCEEWCGGGLEKRRCFRRVWDSLRMSRWCNQVAIVEAETREQVEGDLEVELVGFGNELEVGGEENEFLFKVFSMGRSSKRQNLNAYRASMKKVNGLNAR